MTIEQTDYLLEVPDGSTVDPEDPEIDLDHENTINLPNRTTIIVMVADTVHFGEIQYNKMIQVYPTLMKDPITTPSEMFDTRQGTGVIQAGRLNGMKTVFETGIFTGNDKAFIITCTYKQSIAEVARESLRQALAAFVIK